jgi:hypothetical protein
MPRRAPDKRTQKEKAKALGITDRSYRNYMRKDARFAHLVQRKATDVELNKYLQAKKNGYDYAAPWEDGGSGEDEVGAGQDNPEDLLAVSRRTKVARMRELEEKALRAEIERKKLEGTLIPVEAVAMEYGRAMTTLKNTLMNIGPSIRGELMEVVVEPTAAVTVEKLIIEACRDALESAADSLL